MRLHPDSLTVVFQPGIYQDDDIQKPQRVWEEFHGSIHETGRSIAEFSRYFSQESDKIQSALHNHHERSQSPEDKAHILQLQRRASSFKYRADQLQRLHQLIVKMLNDPQFTNEQHIRRREHIADHWQHHVEGVHAGLMASWDEFTRHLSKLWSPMQQEDK